MKLRSNKRSRDGSKDRGNIALLSLLATTLAAIVYFVYVYDSSAGPRIEKDEAVYGELDAMFTAINSHETKRIDESMARLRLFADEKRFDSDSIRFLKSLIDDAEKNEDWEAAAKKFHRWISSQR